MERNAFEGLNDIHKGTVTTMDMEISPGVIKKTFMLLVSLDTGQSLAIELSGDFNVPKPGRCLQTAIYGDVRHLNEVS